MIKSIQIWIQIINTGVLTITAAIIAWYTWETSKLRHEMVRQNEINLRPYLVPSFPETGGDYKFQLKNIGRGTATNIRVDTVSMNLVDPVAQWKYEFSTTDWLESGMNVTGVEVRVWCNGQSSTMNILLVPQVNRFRIHDANGDRQMGIPWTLRVLFDDVEGGRYLQEFDVTPTEHPESSNVLARPIRRVASDFRFEQQA